MKYLTVPQNKNAEIALDYNEAKPEDLIEIAIEDEEFKQLWDTDIFRAINLVCGSNIDIYESEAITEKFNLLTVLESGILEPKNLWPPKINNLIGAIKNLFEEALKRETGIYFFF